jgi:L-asparaginase II
MALAYARFGVSRQAEAVWIRAAVTANPELIAGKARLCTDILAATGGKIFAKVGADGIYCAYLPEPGLGLALKVEDGDMRSLPTALLGLLRILNQRVPLGFDPAKLPESVSRHAEPPTVNTRGKVTGVLRAAGEPQFLV